MKKLLFVACLFLSAHAVPAQAIEDNSFLLEEAYNQEKGVIQYINAFYRQRNGDFLYGFTNEIPVKTQRHQFSYTINVARVGTATRFADTYINYRYQLKGAEGERVWISPRVSAILPTGSHTRGTGAGAVGFQFNLPVSVRHAKKLVTHWNAGATITPRSRNAAGERATATGLNLGQSTIFLGKEKFNVLVETAWNRNAAVTGPGRTQHSYSLLLNPGIRWAHDLKSGLQIVPGIAFPIGVGPSRGERGVFLYLSFEK